MLKNLSVEKLGIYLIFFIIFFAFMVLEFNFKDDIIMNHHINRTNKIIEDYKELRFDFKELDSNDLYKSFHITDSLQTNLEEKWLSYVTVSIIKNKHNQNIQHRYVKIQQEINFMKLLISTEINRRQYEYIRLNVSNKFKI